jgi:hypothetical protein
VQVSGDNFAASAEVTVYLDAAGATPIGQGATNASGAIAAPIGATIPAGTAPGTHRLFVMDSRSRYPVSAPFQVN